MNGYADGPQLPYTGSSTLDLIVLVGFAVAAIALGLLLRRHDDA